MICGNLLKRFETFQMCLNALSVLCTQSYLIQLLCEICLCIIVLRISCVLLIVPIMSYYMLPNAVSHVLIKVRHRYLLPYVIFSSCDRSMYDNFCQY